MVVVEVCMGSSCFLRGAAGVVDLLKELAAVYGVTHEIVLKGSFCMEQCTHGVTLKIEGELFTEVYQEDVPDLFRSKILPRIKKSCPEE